MSALFCPKWEQKRTHILRPLFIRTLGGKTDVSVCVRLFVSIAPREVCGAAGLCHKSGGCFVSGKYFTGDQKLSKKLIGRTKEALRQRNVQFAQTHGDASDEELLDYVRGEAARLGMTPNAGEIIGGHFIAVRFGCWKNVVTAAGLVPPKKQKPLPKRQIFKEELRCQARERAYTEQQNSSE